MIKRPFVGKRVTILSSGCCMSKCKAGTEGIITRVTDGIDAIRVTDKSGEDWYHYKKCLAPRRRGEGVCEFYPTDKDDPVCDCGSDISGPWFVCTKEYSLDCTWAVQRRKEGENALQ